MDLPEPSADALAASRALTEQIHAEIAAAGGWLPFSRYMELALYTPGLGYYSGGSQKFGEDGDFITSPELTPLFGEALANQVMQVLQQVAAQGHADPVVLEAGAGTGLLAADLLATLEKLEALPSRYLILEISGELRERQRQTIAAKVPHLLSRVEWLDYLPESLCGCVVGNEVLDVMPVDVLAYRDGEIYNRGVALNEQGELAWSDRVAEGALREAAEALPAPRPEGCEYVTEISLPARAWMQSWASRLTCGVMLLVDYGYPQREYYLPSRSTGTLLCYYRHRAHAEPFRWPGLCDITAFVDFTAQAEAAFAAGMDVLGYISQGNFLLNCGVLACLEGRGDQTSPVYIRAARALNRLVGPHEMGELFKVLAVAKDVAVPLLGFMRGDRVHAL